MLANNRKAQVPVVQLWLCCPFMQRNGSRIELTCYTYHSHAALVCARSLILDPPAKQRQVVLRELVVHGREAHTWIRKAASCNVHMARDVSCNRCGKVASTLNIDCAKSDGRRTPNRIYYTQCVLQPVRLAGRWAVATLATHKGCTMLQRASKHRPKCKGWARGTRSNGCGV
jgi:hypothetical protein